MNRTAISGIVVLMIFSFNAVADQRSLMADIVKSVSEACYSPDKKNSYWQVDVKGTGDAKLKLKIADAGVAGEASFTKEEWEGVQNVLKEHQLEENRAYRDCVTTLTPMFLDKFTHIGGDTGRSIRGSSSLVADKEYPSQVVEGKFVSFELTACKNANREVKCSLRVKAKNEDRELSIGSYYAGKTRVFDENGTEYYLSNIKVGDKSDPKYVKKHLIAGVAVPSEVSFGPLPSEVSNLTAMEIFYHASFSKSIKFKNIPVQ